MEKVRFFFAFVLVAVFGACTQIGSVSADGSSPGPMCRHKSYDICWDPSVAEQTGIVPVQGDYEVVPAETGIQISPLDTFDFDVRLVYSTGTRLCVYFSADGYRFDCIEIVDGAFNHTHGGGTDNTICPTEGYVISGSFVSETEARGSFRFIPSCHVTNTGDFIAQYNE